MFSSRLHTDLTPNPLTVLLQAKRAAGETILDLTESNPTHAGFNYPGDEILTALSDPSVLRYDPNPAGLRAAREAVSKYYAERGIEANPGRILLTSSTSEAYGFLFKLLCDPGDEILVPRPSYPLFDYLASLESVNVRQYSLRYDGAWSVDFHSLEASLSSRTRAVVVVNPNNPTGSYLKQAEAQRLEALCAERSIAILSDEVFAGYALREDPHRVISMLPFRNALTFAMSGFSKVVALPQLKLGWIAVNGPEPLKNQAWDRLEWIADTYLSVSAPVQRAAAKLFALRPQIEAEVRSRVTQNLAFLQSQLSPDSPFRMLDLEGGWYATLEVPRTRSEEEWTLELLREDNVLVQPGYFYDFEREGYLILSLLTPADTFAEGVRRLFRLG